MRPELHSPATITRRYRADGEPATAQLAASLARTCIRGDCLLLSGDLGAGKTAFARGFIQAVKPGVDVVSPTFNLLQTYDAQDGALISHYDLYRLKSEAELPEIGLDEALQQGITLIEWPEIAESYWPQDALTITLRQESETTRTITFSGAASRWQSHLPPENG